MIGSQLKQLLANRHMPVGELARQVNVPVQTLYSIIRRDNMKIDFDLLLRICDVLDISVDYFCTRERMPACPNAPSPDEWDLLAKYRALDDFGRETINLLLSRELQRSAPTPDGSDQ